MPFVKVICVRLKLTALFIIVSFQEKPGNSKQVHIKIIKSLPRILDLLKDQQISPDEFGIDNQNEVLSWNRFPNEVDPSRGRNSFKETYHIFFF